MLKNNNSWPSFCLFFFKVSQSRVGVMGHSMGGRSSIISTNDEQLDFQIDAVVALMPALYSWDSSN